MHINWTPRDLDIFLVLAETGSFRRTAAQVHLSQSAVSGVIARLEDALGTRLFDRTTRSVHLTAAGQVFVEQAKLLNAQTHEAVQRVLHITQIQSGKVSLAALPSLAATVVPRVMARYAEQHPEIALQLHDTLSGPAFDLVRAGTVDFALTAANPDYADLDYTPLSADGFVLLIPLNHRLAKGKTPLNWLQVAELTHISMPLPASVRQYANAAFIEHRIAFQPRYEVEHIATIHAMVKAGLGVAALPELAAAFVQQEGVLTRRLTGPDIQRPLGVVTRRNRSLSPAAQEMVRMLRQETTALLP
ncbi:LysR family transcriptional regulator [Limnohabitans sp. MMS-10A-160]|uniref:LysR family transcriptional regulator n=1 Tax=unclassified Limnohabitans TaxID=2626134 RepID=UPI000D3D1818|nr:MULTISPECIES: LysR family transcriptional regulator [unclassified Limnohabitans]PUE19183.1 LysR family transcriptional regulator [Limnohabitans sp. MMS-10A-192]PUE26072.1 LysR family transcriptional regulator [Limnohabitans sp. MMS-10A-160]